MKLLKNEVTKNIKWKVLLIALIFILAVNIVQILIVDKGNMENWKEDAIQLKQSYTEGLEECIEEGIDERYYSAFEQQIKIIDYSLEHNIPYGVMTMKKHVIRMIDLFRILVIAIVFLISGVVADEYEACTWKNLLMTGISKSKLLYTKILFCWLYALFLLLCYFIVSVICGIIAFGFQPTSIGLELVDGTVMQVNQYIEILKDYVIFAIKLVFYATVTVTAVVFLKKGIMALLIASILSFANGFISSIISVDVINDILPFRYLAITKIGNTMELIKMLCVLCIYIILFVVISRVKFEKSDIV